MPVKHRQKPAPRTNAPIEEHRKHAKEFLAKDEYENKPEKSRDKTDEAKP